MVLITLLRRTSRFCQRHVVMPCYCLDRSIDSTWQRNGNRHWQRRHAYYVQGGSVIRITLLHAFFNQEPNGILEQRDFFKCYIRDGRFYLSDLDQPGYVYLSTIEEFRAKFAVAGFIQLVLACVESFANYDQTSLLKANPENTEVWLDLSEQTGSTPERLGMTGHFLYV